MQDNEHILDTNAVLRFLLQDLEDQYAEVRQLINTEKCCVPLEVMAEVCYVLEYLYQVPRDVIVQNIRRLNNDVVIFGADVLYRALEIFAYPPKLDFVDCIMYGYKAARGHEIITYDKKLLKKLQEAEF